MLMIMHDLSGHLRVVGGVVQLVSDWLLPHCLLGHMIKSHQDGLDCRWSVENRIVCGCLCFRPPPRFKDGFSNLT